MWIKTKQDHNEGQKMKVQHIPTYVQLQTMEYIKTEGP